MSDSEHELRSFGRRRGRKPSARQSALLLHDLPRLSFDPAAPPEGFEQTWLEIGFGGGEHLLWQARHNPGVALIGCEPFEDGMIKVLTAVTEENLKNIRLHMDDVRDILRAAQSNSIDRAFILFPDPWPKRKHRKRRLVNTSLLALLANVMRPGAELRIGTDIGDYARTMLEAFAHEPRFLWQATSPEDWRIRPADWPETRYEAKAVREGRKRYYFRFLRA
ncbi:tRNA (guanosine(46)-N(7))-methyltransferase TrmB [Hyphomicrobium sp. MC1]|uniref:tRNA (guanine(46)-N(7))-methyltransferase TrmB n=1 Tax=Hyphomicrobium sp. (strain MC1) TaxID=717785 RepID=UPI000213F28E|nr:tRNA (guanine(46)-N(7))-methyltransferase TrmB [Hyphomicrobium sp. MC1]CCB67976.1 tRNA (guanine-N(7)-)-methyltransferase (tRNA(m7G46)-methyltransferase) [Hyphomicrobium sp. MC1]